MHTDEVNSLFIVSAFGSKEFNLLCGIGVVSLQDHNRNVGVSTDKELAKRRKE